MVEAIRISRSAYPYRITYEDFWERFHQLRTTSWHHKQKSAFENGMQDDVTSKAQFNQDNKRVVILVTELMSEIISLAPSSPHILQCIEASKNIGRIFDVGYTKIYFVDGMMDILAELLRKLKYSSASCLQSIARMVIARKKFLVAKKAICKLQSLGRMKIQVTKNNGNFYFLQFYRIFS